MRAPMRPAAPCFRSLSRVLKTNPRPSRLESRLEAWYLTLLINRLGLGQTRRPDRASSRQVEFVVASSSTMPDSLAFASLEATDRAMWNRPLSIVDASFHLARAAGSYMRRQGYERIVLTTSGRAMRVEHSVHGLVAYTAAKLAQSCP